LAQERVVGHLAHAREEHDVPYLYLCVYLLEDVTGEKVKELRSTEPWSRLEL